jgi:hypothetical protein
MIDGERPFAPDPQDPGPGIVVVLPRLVLISAAFAMSDDQDFYLRYYVGHHGKFG